MGQTLEEEASSILAKLQQELRQEVGHSVQVDRMYSEKDLSDAFFVGRKTTLSYLEWLEQFKKKSNDQ